MQKPEDLLSSLRKIEDLLDLAKSGNIKFVYQAAEETKRAIMANGGVYPQVKRHGD